ncbi:flagellar basal-body rod protein FlgF [Fuchsiella alkaliacetigena]|uniref:flagellar basal-body rod protein FlgF n=1 Tax=Fuchsiella alkaliacetigena TaxID=957042 RepID=UPI00200AE046|nr:flagellar basal-body rod protein FlgF [Fuchsiella alkaliacetigena]MCK8824574.1 flagellar basal-body rod protein FlgF [Fuchsiella alkaliacetigena]
MLRGMYTAASGMNEAKKRNDVVTNNLANVNTTAYKKDQAVSESFKEMLLKRLPDNKELGSLGTGVKLDGTYTDYSSGGLEKTQNTLDWAIDGEGFFAVQTPEGIRYTRNGNFSLNEQGQIVTQDGNLVMGQAGPLEAFGEEISLDNDNNLIVDGAVVDQVQVVTFDDLDGLVQEGSNLYEATPEVGNEFMATGTIQQGYLEASNVNVVESMTEMIEATRQYEANQRVISTYDDTLEQAVNSVGNV